MLKNFSIPARVEKYPLTAILHQRGKSPGFGHSRGLAKCVVQNRDAIGALTFAKSWKQKNSQAENPRKSKTHDVLLQKARSQRANIVAHCSPVESVLPRSRTGTWSVGGWPTLLHHRHVGQFFRVPHSRCRRGCGFRRSVATVLGWRC